jgi:hypothetical protein
MIKYTFFLFTALAYSVSLFSQGHENTMIFGYYGGSASPTNDEYGLNLLTFTHGSLEIGDEQTSELFFNDTAAAISDTAGNLMFYFNGIDIYNHQHVLMEGGDTLNPYKSTGYDLPQGGIIIPNPAQIGKYYLIHQTEYFVPNYGLCGIGLYASVIDMTQNNGLGKVVERKKPLVIDTLEYGKIAVVRHANGKFWWLVVGESESNAFYVFLVTHKGIFLKGKQAIGVPRRRAYGQSFFSPDGTKFVMLESIDYNGEFDYLEIYDFDRCSGTFSNHEHIHLIGSVGGSGIAIAPNSRWLYTILHNKIYQFDLSVSPTLGTHELVGEYEVFLDPFPTNFHLSFLAPDNKIYITTTSGSRTLHVIHNPDGEGESSGFENHGVRLNCNNNGSLPTFADYRLGPLDNSPCDTLGINNDPRAWYRYEQDTLNPNHIIFHDLSYHEPTTWSWNFGDGNTSTERHPSYVYPLPGVYEACLTVSNVHGIHTHCKTIYGVTAAHNPVLQAQIQVTPNPFSTHIAVALSAQLRSPMLHLYDLTGRLVREQPLKYGISEINTAELAKGMYFWQVLSAGEVVKVGKAVKI